MGDEVDEDAIAPGTGYCCNCWGSGEESTGGWVVGTASIDCSTEELVWEGAVWCKGASVGIDETLIHN